ncbi:MAG: CBS domain-containing protein [Desulfoplanes sp.]|nr:CBS domain-containing protein [Desulfoplanes sp.]MDD4648416.1 CBS domain-containing protein [Desulfoplanes sp.]
MLLRKRAWDVMREEYPAVKENTSLSIVIKTLEDSRKEYPDNNFVLVLSQDGKKCLGLLSMWNIIQAIGPCLLKGVGMTDQDVDWDKAFKHACMTCSQVDIKEFMQVDVPRINPNEPLARVLEIFLDYRRGRAIVEDGERILGVVLLADLYMEISHDVMSWEEE